MTQPHITLYGIANCDTVKKSRAWLAAQGIYATYHDFKKHGVPADRLPRWAAAVGWQKLLNRQGTTWRKLDPATHQAVQSAETALALMRDHPSVIKRPVVEWGEEGSVSVGFVPDQWLAWKGSGNGGE